MTFEDKNLLSSNISKLDSLKLAKVVEIIQSRAPKASSQANETEIEIDLDKLDNVTLRQVEKYVKTASMSKSKKSKPVSKSLNVSQTKDLQTPQKNNEETESSEGESSTDSDTDDEKKNTNEIPIPITKDEIPIPITKGN